VSKAWLAPTLSAITVPFLLTVPSHSAIRSTEGVPVRALTHTSFSERVRTKWFYYVRPGDTLSALAKKFYGHASRWPALWLVNRWHNKNPNVIRVGERLTLESWHPKKKWITETALAAIPKPVQRHTRLASVQHYSGSHSYRSTTTVSVAGMGAFQACVIQHESGGDAQIWNASGHWGAYQFSFSTWVAHGGDPALFGKADFAYQTEIFWNTVRADGTSDWAPYDGC